MNLYLYFQKLGSLKLQKIISCPQEFVLLSHPKVLEACVIGVENEEKQNGSQMPKAYLVLRNENEVMPNEEEMAAILEQIRQFANGIKTKKEEFI